MCVCLRLHRVIYYKIACCILNSTSQGNWSRMLMNDDEWFQTDCLVAVAPTNRLRCNLLALVHVSATCRKRSTFKKKNVCSYRKWPNEWNVFKLMWALCLKYRLSLCLKQTTTHDHTHIFPKINIKMHYTSCNAAHSKLSKTTAKKPLYIVRTFFMANEDLLYENRLPQTCRWYIICRCRARTFRSYTLRYVSEIYKPIQIIEPANNT